MKTSKLCVLGGVFAVCLAAGAETPDRFIRYAEATGVQAVDVGVRGRYGTKMEASIEWTALWDSVTERVFWPNAPFSAVGPVTRKFDSPTVIMVR